VEIDATKCVIGMNDDPKIEFCFDADIHSKEAETPIVLTGIGFDGIRKDGVPNTIWEQIRDFCNKEIERRKWRKR
jgi:hypothetical protein